MRAARSLKYKASTMLAEVTGLKAVTVRAHENGQNGMTHKIASQYAAALDVTPEWLLYGSGSFGDRPVSDTSPKFSLETTAPGRARISIVEAEVSMDAALKIGALLSEGAQ